MGVVAELNIMQLRPRKQVNSSSGTCSLVDDKVPKATSLNSKGPESRTVCPVCVYLLITRTPTSKATSFNDKRQLLTLFLFTTTDYAVTWVQSCKVEALSDAFQKGIWKDMD